MSFNRAGPVLLAALAAPPQASGWDLAALPLLNYSSGEGLGYGLSGAAYLRGLFARHPNLYVDTAFGCPRSTYKPSGERHARVWDGADIRREWKELIADHPYRFLAALDIGGDRTARLEEWVRGLRDFLERVPDKVRPIVAYGAGWKLLFGEDIVAG